MTNFGDYFERNKKRPKRRIRFVFFSTLDQGVREGLSEEVRFKLEEPVSPALTVGREGEHPSWTGSDAEVGKGMACLRFGTVGNSLDVRLG